MEHNLETISTCPICGNKSSNSFLTCNDYTVSKKAFNIVACQGCGFKYTNPRPKEVDLGKYYQSEDYVSHTGTKKGLVNRVYHIVRNYTIGKKVKLINTLSPKGNILDIGSGTGEFLSACKNNGWQTLGVEPSPLAKDFAEKEYGLTIHDESYLDEIEDKSYNVITMWHVLEHVAQLNKRVKQLKRILKDNGVLIIAVPNCSSYDAEHYGKYWAAYDVPRHLYHFVPDDIINLFDKEQMQLVEILPMRFDSYYVSMLSEKYKDGKGNLISAFFTGLKSNLKAKKTGYSSLIYILRNKT